jgi:hypothetical protein
MIVAHQSHITVFAVFTRARQQASWNGKHATVIEPHYPVLQGQTGTYFEDCSAAEVGVVCRRTRKSC